jgi:hypothetical protein
MFSLRCRHGTIDSCWTEQELEQQAVTYYREKQSRILDGSKELRHGAKRTRVKAEGQSTLFGH